MHSKLHSPLRLLQADMLAKARAEFDACIERVYDFDQFMAALDRKHMCLAPWCARDQGGWGPGRLLPRGNLVCVSPLPSPCKSRRCEQCQFAFGSCAEV